MCFNGFGGVLGMIFIKSTENISYYIYVSFFITKKMTKKG